MFALIALVCVTLATPACGPAGTEGKSTTSRSKKKRKKRKRQTGAQLLKAGIKAEKNGNPTKAEKKYRRALRVRPKHEKTASRLIKFLIKQGKARDAVDVGKLFLDRNPSSQTAHHLTATAQIAAGQLTAAHGTLSDVLAIYEDDALAYEMRGRVRVLLKKYMDALIDLRKAVALDESNADYRVSLGSGLHRAGKLDEAALTLRGALQLAPKHARAHLVLGMVLRDNFDLKQAVVHHMKAVKYGGSARAYFELGTSERKRGDSLAAQQQLAKATKLAPNDITYWYVYGDVLWEVKEWKQAIAAYKRVLALDPKRKHVKNKLGLVLFMDRRYDEAEVILTEAIRAQPKEPYPYFNVGMVYEKLGKYSFAVGAFRKFLQLAPKSDGDRRAAQKKIQLLKKKLPKRGRSRRRHRH